MILNTNFRISVAISHASIPQLAIATKRSDKYLEEQYKTSGKNKSAKKSKKSKKSKHKPPSSESDEGKKFANFMLTFLLLTLLFHGEQIRSKYMWLVHSSRCPRAPVYPTMKIKTTTIPTIRIKHSTSI